VYRLIRTPDYQRELDEIDAGAGTLDQRLQGGLYFFLERTPRQGWLLGDTGVWYRSQVIIPGLMLVRVYYRIDDQTGTVTLVSIRSVDMTIL